MSEPPGRAGEHGDAERLYHELKVHQEELLLQNEELRSARADAEAALQRYTDLYEFAPVAYLTVDDQGLVLDANLTATTLLHKPRTRLRRQRLRGFIAPADRPKFEEFLAALSLPGADTSLELGVITADGTALWCDVKGGRDPHTATILLAIHDRTEQRRMEEALLRGSLQQAEGARLEAVGRLAAGVAHDFNNYLMAINGTAELLGDAMPEGDPSRSDVEVILEAGRQAAALTTQLLAFGRRLPLKPVAIDLRQAIERVVPMLRRVLGEGCTLELDLAASLDPVIVDPLQLERVVVNLVLNARDAMPDGGTVTIALSGVEVTADVAAAHPQAVGRRHARLAVSDGGIGIDPAAMPRLFEPFYTTKEMGHGTGLGLAMVEGIVAQSGGWIDVTSEVGSGTTFAVALPCGAPMQCQGTPRATVSSAGAGTVLYVEDELSVRAAVARMLRSLGFAVIEMSDPERAVALDDPSLAAVDLLLTDVVMPRMRGTSLADRLTERRPGLPVIFVSGYAPDVALGTRAPALTESFLAKPFTRAELLSALDDALAAARAEHA